MSGDFLTIKVRCYNKKCRFNSDYYIDEKETFSSMTCMKALNWQEPPVIASDGICRWYEAELEKDKGEKH